MKIYQRQTMAMFLLMFVVIVIAVVFGPEMSNWKYAYGFAGGFAALGWHTLMNHRDDK